MGLFSSKTVTNVGTVVSRVIKDELLPKATQTGVLKSILNQGEMSDYIMEEMIGSIAVKAERMYEYAKKSYTYGLPSGQRLTTASAYPSVITVLQAIHGTTPTIDYCHVAPPNDLHIGWMSLISTYGYIPETNELTVLTTQKKTPVYLKDMVVIVPASQLAISNAGSYAQWGTAARAGDTPIRAGFGPTSDVLEPSPVYSDPNASSERLRVTYTWKELVQGKEVIKEEELFIPITGFVSTDSYVHVKYIVNGSVRYFMYRIGTGTYALLDALTKTAYKTTGTYFPFAYFRYNKVSQAKDKTTAAYKTSKKLVKYFGMNFDDVSEAIDENPDIGDVEQAMMVMGVPAVSDDPIDRRYLFDFFNQLYIEDSEQKTTRVESIIDSSLRTPTSAVVEKTIVIEDKRFKMALTNQGIYKRTLNGKIGSVGDYDSGYSTESISEPYVDFSSGQQFTRNTSVKSHYYRRQVTESLYEEVRVFGLKMVYYIFGDYTTTGDENDDILLIPIDRSISSEYSIPDRETLYARSMHYVFNSRTVTKLKWYQTGLFQVIVVVVAIVITVLTEGATAELIAAALGVGAVAAMAIVVVINLVLGQLIAEAFKLFVKAFGKDFATLVAIIAIIYGSYQVIEAGSVAGAPMAKQLLQVSTGLSKAVLEAKFNDLLADASEFQAFIEEQTKLLDKGQDLLDTNAHLSPFIIFGESPNDFFNRTVHSGNIGVLGIDAISSYTDIALTLPTLNETLGGNS